MRIITKLVLLTLGFTFLYSCEPESLPDQKQGSEKVNIHNLKPFGGDGDQDDPMVIPES